MAVSTQTLKVVVKSEGITTVNNQILNLGTRAESTEKKVQKLVETVENMAKKFVQSSTGTKALTDALSVVNRTTSASDKAMKDLATSMALLSGAVSTLSNRMNTAGASVTNSTVNIRHHTRSMNDAHAAARGLTGSLGALWLTYGSVVPLAVGAAIGASFKQVITQGMEFQNTLKGIEVRGQETAASMASLRAEIDKLGQGIYGPMEVAKAFETLILAGLNARKAVEAIGPTLNFAVAGAVPIEKAAFTLVQVATALGYTAEGFGRVGDVIAKTAAVSMSSVESLSEAFKSASSVGVVFGSSITDIGTSLAALSNLGINGSAAGTALKNMLKELDSNADRVKKTLAAVGVDVERDLKQFGKFKDINTIFQVLSNAIDKFGDQGGKAMQAISNERGLRALAAGLQLYRKEMTESGNALKDLNSAINDSAGYAALGAARISLTSKNQVESTMNTLRTTFVKTFDDMAPKVNLFARELRTIFKSDEFASAMKTAGSALADFLLTMIRLTPVIVEVGKAFLVMKAGMIASEVIIGASKAYTALAASIALVRTAGLGIATIFGGVVGVITAAAAAWYLYGTKKDKALDTSVTKEAIATSENFIDSLKKEEDRLDKNIANLEKMKTVKEALAQTNRDLALSELVNKNNAAIATAQESYDASLKYVPANQRAMIPEYAKKQGSISSKAYGDIPDAIRAYQNLQEAKDNADKSLKKTEETLDRLNAKYKRESALVEQRLKDEQAADRARANLVAGDNPPSVGGNDSDKPQAMNAYQTFFMAQDKWIAGHAARVNLMKQEGAIGKAAAMGQYEAEAMSFLQSDLAKEQLKELSAAELKRYQLKILNAAVQKDELKEEESKLQTYTELTNRIKEANLAEEQRIALSAKGIDIGKYEGQVLAKQEGLKLSEEQLKKDREAAQIRDKQIAQADAAKRLESATASSTQRAEQYADEMAALDKYGVSVRQTAVEFAKAEIAKRGFLEDSSEGKGRLSAAGLEDYNLGLLNITKEYERLQTEMREQDGMLLKDTIGVEQAKVLAYKQTRDKYIEFETERVKAGLAAQVASGEMSEQAADKAMADYEAKIQKLKALSNQDFAVKFDISGLKDISNIFNDIADTSDKMGEGFENVTRAMDGFSEAFRGLAKARDLDNKKAGEGEAARIGAYGDMAAAAGQFFSEGSTGYRAMAAASKVLYMAEMSLSVIKGVNAILTQGEGDPYSAFGRMAAMAAIVAGLGVAVSGSIGGGSSGMTADEVQKTQGTGSVFGAASSQSESISKSLDLLEENSDLMLPLTSAMLKSLQSIEASMAGLGNLIAGTAGVVDGGFANTGTYANRGSVGNAILSTTKFFGGIGPMGDIMQSLASSILGKVTKTVIDSGITFGGSLDSLQGGQGYNQYATIETTKKKLFGLVKKSSTSQETQALDAELASQFGLIFTNLEDALKAAAGGFGKTGTEVGDALSNMVIEQTTLSLKGLEGDELTAAINAVISKTMDDIAQTAFPGLDSFRQVGEGYAQTVLRVSSGIEQANVTLEQFNITAIKYADITNKQGDVAAEIFRQSVLAVEGLTGVGNILNSLSGDITELADTYTALKTARSMMNGLGINGNNLSVDTIKGAGGLDALQDGLDSYFENILSEEQQAAYKTSELAKQFAELGMAVPSTKDAFAALVKQVDDGTVSGNKLVGKLLSLSEAFAEVTDSISEVSFAAVDSAFSIVQKAINARKDELNTAYNSQVAAIRKLAEAEKEAAQERLTAAQESLSAITDVFNKLSGALGSTAIQSDAIDRARRAEAQTYLKSIAGTDLTKATGLDGALGALSADSKKMFSTFEDYAMDQALSASLVGNLTNQANVQKTFGELTVERLQDTITAIDESTNKQLEELQKQHEEQIAALDRQLEIAQQQVEILKGTYIATLSVVDAISGLASSIGSYTASTGGSSEDVIEKMYGTLLGRSSDAEGKAYWTEKLQSGWTMSDIAKGFTNSAEYKSLTKFDVGTNYIPEDMPAMVHKGERIIPAADNAELMRRLDGSSDNSSEVAELKAAISELKEIVRTGDVANVQMSKQMVQILREWNQNGMPEERNTIG